LGITKRKIKELEEEVVPNAKENQKRQLIENLLTAKEVAEMIGCSKKTVYSWAELGNIPCIKFGQGKKSLLRFNPEKIQEWIEARERKASGTGEQEACYYKKAETVAEKPRKGGR
jgi:excisionase family DNA binding protein